MQKAQLLVTIQLYKKNSDQISLTSEFSNLEKLHIGLEKIIITKFKCEGSDRLFFLVFLRKAYIWKGRSL